MICREYKWTPIEKALPGDATRFCLGTYVSSANGVRYNAVYCWDAEQKTFVRMDNGDTRDNVVAWLEINDSREEGAFEWKDCADFDIEHYGAEFVLAMQIVFTKDEDGNDVTDFKPILCRTLVALKIDPEHCEFIEFASVPEPYDDGMGRPWGYGEIAVDYEGWRLGSLTLHRRYVDDIGNYGEFGRKLVSACEDQFDNSNDYVTVDLFAGVEERFLKKDIVRTQAYDWRFWNNWPCAMPPQEAVDEKVPFRVEYEHGGTFKGGCFYFDGTHFYNEEMMLVEGNEVDVPETDLSLRRVRLVNFAMWRTYGSVFG